MAARHKHLRFILSRKKERESEDFSIPRKPYQKLEEPEYIVQAEKYYLEKFAKCFQRQVTLDEAIEYLHGKITENLQEQRQKLTPCTNTLHLAKSIKPGKNLRLHYRLRKKK